ncbi:6034_t:CDS:2, partial [Dentiscutata heterogama]
NNSTIQSNIQIPAIDNNIYQNSFEFNLNSEEFIKVYQDYENNLENYSNFDDNLEVDGFGDINKLLNSLKGRNKFDSDNELVNSLENEDKFEDNDELGNSLVSRNEFEDNNESWNSLESKNEFEDNDKDEFISKLEYKNSDNKLEDNSNISTITKTRIQIAK